MCSLYSVSAVSESYTNGDVGQTGYAYGHELGHSLGAIHDATGTAASCPANINIMSPSIIMSLPHTFSSCSVANINGFLESTSSSCLGIRAGYGVTSGNVTMCGNGIVDEGEQCDTFGVATACCNANCTFKANAQCDDSNGQCCQSCKIASNSTICRPYTNNPFTDACTLPLDRNTKCDGTNIYCPLKSYIQSGTVCNANSASGFCNEGYCLTRPFICSQYGLTFGKCDKQNACTVICDNGNSCYNTQIEMTDGVACGAGSNGTCQVGTCIFPTPPPQVVSSAVVLNSSPHSTGSFSNVVSTSKSTTFLVDLSNSIDYTTHTLTTKNESLLSYYNSTVLFVPNETYSDNITISKDSSTVINLLSQKSFISTIVPATVPTRKPIIQTTQKSSTPSFLTTNIAVVASPVATTTSEETLQIQYDSSSILFISWSVLFFVFY
eukprot:NODE_123_length_17687_cov_0.732261.p6 type:complete len:438 gc:universal NODE_123_length_17687_cov_0.732261:6381-7694(+)